jgi:hypothetical protein
MIERLRDLPDNVDGLRMSGHVSRDEYQQVVLPLMQECLARGGGIRLLIVIDDDFDRFEAGALWEDLKFGLGQGLELSRWERMALVSDEHWVHHAITLFGWLVPGEIKVYPLAEQPQATAWLAA